MKASDMMPIEHDQAQMWQLSADRRSLRMELPGLPAMAFPFWVMERVAVCP